MTLRKQQEEELRASRTRIVAAGDDARRRLERNLHDGAQQRLVSLSLALRLAQAKLDDRPRGSGARSSPARARSSPRRSRSCASSRAASTRPCSPTAASAPRSRGSRRARRCRSRSTALDERLPEPIEAAAYYVVSEAITNVVKHAEASSVDVRVAAVDGAVTIEVADDGDRRAPTRAWARACAASPTASPRSTARCASRARRAGGTRVVAEIPIDTGSPAAGAGDR